MGRAGISILIGLVLLVALAWSLDPSKVLTNPQRTANVGQYCKVPREQLVLAADIATARSYGTIVNLSFSIDPMKFAEQASITNSSNIVDFAGQVTPGVVLTSGPFMLGVVLSLTLWTFLLCCCVCPGSCPSKCCQHSNHKLYSRCELYWPAVVVVAAVFMACGSSIPGLLQASRLTDGVESLECAYSVMLDDLLNGNITQDGKHFFTGGILLQRQLGYLGGNLSAISANLYESTNQLFVGLLNSTSTTSSDLEKLPNTTSNSSFTLSYTDPTWRAINGTTVLSSYGGVLGTAQQNGSLCGSLYRSVSNISGTFNSLLIEVAGLQSVAPSITQQISSVTKTIDNSNSIVEQNDNDNRKVYDQIEDYKGYINLGMGIFHGVVLGLCAMAIISTSISVFCNKPDCRYFIYGVCAAMVLVAILGMIVALVLSVIMPVTFIGCSVLTSGLESPSNFLKYIDIFKLSSPEAEGLSECLPGGSGSFLDGIGSEGQQLNAEFNMFLQVMNDVKSGATYNSNPLQQQQSTMTDTTNQFVSAGINDLLADAPSDTWFRSIANRLGPESCLDNSVYQADCLVPSLSPSSLARIPCIEQPVYCTDFATCASGCIDMNSVMSSAGTVNAFLAKIAQRYSSTPQCVTDLSEQFKINYNNWFAVRTDPNIGISSVQTRWEGTSTKVDSVQSYLSALQQQLWTQWQSINSTIPRVIDQTNGLLPGINCLMMGEDLILVKNAACVNIFNSLYVSLVTVGISSFALLLAMCCMVCSGVRQYKQLEKLKAKQYWEEVVKRQRQNENPDIYHAMPSINYPDA